MAQRGTWIGLAVWLAVGCADSERKPDGTENDRDAAVDGGGGGAGGAGAGGTGSGAGMGGGEDGPACEDLPMPGVYACVQGDGIPLRGTGPVHVELTGIVERTKAGPLACMEENASRTFGNVGQHGQSYVVRDGATAIELTLGTGSSRPLLTDGQRVRVVVDEMPNGSILLQDSAVLSVRDDADGRLLYWFARTDDGLDGLELPDGFSASNVGPECMFDWDCGVKHRRGLALLEGSEEIAIPIGELREIGEVAALLLDNTELTLGTGGSCLHVAPYRRVNVALFDRDLISKCDWRDEDSCTDDDDCRDVHARLVGSGNPSAELFLCVVDNSCSDGDLPTCEINDGTAQIAEFSTNCVPAGWTAVDHDACEEDTDAGSP